MKLEDITDQKLQLIHTAFFNVLTALDLGLIFSARQAITNEVILMIRTARDDGQHVLTEHLKFQEGEETQAPQAGQ
jgi:hypothetical protein